MGRGTLPHLHPHGARKPNLAQSHHCSSPSVPLSACPLVSSAQQHLWACGCALRCLDPTYPDSPLGPSQDASLASQCRNRGSNSKLKNLLPPWECIAADVEKQDSHCLAEAQVAIACFLAALRRRRTNNFERDVVSARGPAEERTGVPSLRPRWNTAGGNCQQTCEQTCVNVWIGVCVRVYMSMHLCVARVCG